jgi:integrase
LQGDGIMSIYRVGNGWYIDLYVDGRRKRKAVGSRREAENALTAVKADILRGEFKFKRESKVHFEAFANDYLEHVRTNKKKSWQRDDNSLKFLKAYFGGMLLSKISPWDIEENKKKRLEGEIKIKLEPGSRKRKEWKVKPATINRELACLKHMFTLAKKWKMADGNPVKEVQFFQEQQIEMRILTREEIDRLLSCASPRLRPILNVALNTGMRKGEILHLRWSDVDFDNQFLLLRETKSNRPRKVPMSGLVAETLRPLKKEKEYVFANPQTGKPLSDLQTPFKAACKRADIKDLRFHDLRHTAAT